jgi:hypothetical protein
VLAQTTLLDFGPVSTKTDAMLQKDMIIVNRAELLPKMKMTLCVKVVIVHLGMTLTTNKTTYAVQVRTIRRSVRVLAKSFVISLQTVLSVPWTTNASMVVATWEPILVRALW